jgi:hypothetical protein
MTEEKYLITEKGRECPKCGEFKEWEEFGKRKGRPSGYASSCKECGRKYARKYSKSNKQKINQYAKEYRSNNKEQIEEYMVGYRTTNAENTKEYNKRYKEENKESLKEHYLENFEATRHIREQYYCNNKEVMQSNNKRYRHNNKEGIKAKAKRYDLENKAKRNYRNKERRKSDLNFKIVTSLRSRMGNALKAQNSEKFFHALDILGCSPAECVSHLEKQFTEGMSWSNHAKDGWHIDHIRPCASFDLTIPEQQKLCFHYTNLQPLWWYDNLEKLDKWEEDLDNE